MKIPFHHQSNSEEWCECKYKSDILKIIKQRHKLLIDGNQTNDSQSIPYGDGLKAEVDRKINGENKLQSDCIHHYRDNIHMGALITVVVVNWQKIN